MILKRQLSAFKLIYIYCLCICYLFSQTTKERILDYTDGAGCFNTHPKNRTLL